MGSAVSALDVFHQWCRVWHLLSSGLVWSAETTALLKSWVHTQKNKSSLPKASGRTSRWDVGLHFSLSELRGRPLDRAAAPWAFRLVWWLGRLRSGSRHHTRWWCRGTSRSPAWSACRLFVSCSSSAGWLGWERTVRVAVVSGLQGRPPRRPSAAVGADGWAPYHCLTPLSGLVLSLPLPSARWLLVRDRWLPSPFPSKGEACRGARTGDSLISESALQELPMDAMWRWEKKSINPIRGSRITVLLKCFVFLKEILWRKSFTSKWTVIHCHDSIWASFSSRVLI